MSFVNTVSRDVLSVVCAFSADPYTTNQVCRLFNEAWPDACRILVDGAYRPSPLFGRMLRFAETDHPPDLIRQVFQRYSGMRMRGEHPFDLVSFVRRGEISTVALATRFEEETFTPGRFHRMTDEQLLQAAERARAQEISYAEDMQTLQISSDLDLYEIPEEILRFPHLQTIDFTGCHNLTHIPSCIARLEYLAFVTLADTSVRCLPPEIGDMDGLQVLDLQGCAVLRSLPEQAARLQHLARLNVSGCRRLQYIPEALFRSQHLLIEGDGAPAVERRGGPAIFEAGEYQSEGAAASPVPSAPVASAALPPVRREAFTAPVVASSDSRCCVIS